MDLKAEIDLICYIEWSLIFCFKHKTFHTIDIDGNFWTEGCVSGILNCISDSIIFMVIISLIIYLQKIPLDTTYFPTQKYKTPYHATNVIISRITILHFLPTSKKSST